MAMATLPGKSFCSLPRNQCCQSALTHVASWSRVTVPIDAGAPGSAWVPPSKPSVSECWLTSARVAITEPSAATAWNEGISWLSMNGDEEKHWRRVSGWVGSAREGVGGDAVRRVGGRGGRGEAAVGGPVGAGRFLVAGRRVGEEPVLRPVL